VRSAVARYAAAALKWQMNTIDRNDAVGWMPIEKPP
jgi:hypothetical protein